MLNSTISYSSNNLDLSMHPVSFKNKTRKSENEHLSMFYIGNMETSNQHLLDSFNDNIQVNNYAEALDYIKNIHLYNKVSPDVLIIDMPLNIAELTAFCSYLNQEKLLFKTPIIFNEKRLNPLQILSLREMKLVDDVVDIDSATINFNRKILFLKKIIWEQEKKLTRKNLKSDNKRIQSPVNFKRILDIVLSSVAIFLFLPVFLLVALAIRLESKGPVFYAAQRAGRGFKIFKFYKFRSMIVDADKKIDSLSHLNQYNSTASGPLFIKIDNDPRVTKVGKFLRNTSLDELPQLVNVLKGDMSLVGNRPLPIYEAVTLTTDNFVDRFAGPAGITGLWQVKKRGKAEMTVEERVNLDIDYSKRYNTFFDLKILAMTPIALFQKSDV